LDEVWEGGKEKRGSKISDMCNWVKDGQSYVVGIEVLLRSWLDFERLFVNAFIPKLKVKL